jgi:hypothetical protein
VRYCSPELLTIVSTNEESDIGPLKTRVISYVLWDLCHHAVPGCLMHLEQWRWCEILCVCVCVCVCVCALLVHHEETEMMRLF